MSGKTTNLQQLHDRAPARAAGELVTLDTHSERTLHFDLLPMDIGQVNGHQVRFEFYTVPGQSYYASTRRLVLEGADAIVFVSDSRREALDENIDSMNDLFDNWRHLNLANDIPVVMQYNKQDLQSALKPEQLDPLLNSRHWPSHTAVAVNGVGVVETMRTVAGLVMENIKKALEHASPSKIAAKSVPPPIPEDEKTWLITCYRCQNMLEISGAKKGDLFTCGACSNPIEVLDLDRGLTHAPRQQAAVNKPMPIPAPRDDSGYGMQALPSAAPSPSMPNAGTSSSGGYAINAPGTADLGAGFELPGFESLALLEETVQGRRFRVRDSTSGNRYRALVINAALARQTGYAGTIDPYVRMASKIRHANILPLHSLHQGKETPIILSHDATDHESLAHVLARRRILAPPHALQIAKQIALACEEAARQGVVHGWLRPDIILLNADSQVLIDEFGVPKHHHYLTRELSGASAATEYYLAPEHLKEEARSDIRSDMFMLGSLLFRMLTGEGLVTGYTCHEALHKASAQGCRTARSVQPNLSRDIDNFIARLVAIDRNERFEQWNQVIDLCSRFGGGAKQGTFHLTQTVKRPGGTGTHRHPGNGGGTGRIPQPGTGSHRNPSGSVQRHTAHVHRGTSTHRNPSGDHFPAATRGTGAHRRPSSGNGGMFMVLLALLLLAAGVIVWMVANPRRPTITTPTASESPRTTPTQAPSLASAATTPTATKPPATPPEETKKPRIPSFVGGGTPPVKPAQPTDPTPVATTTPGVVPEQIPTPATEIVSEDEIPRIRSHIMDALRDEKFRLALDHCEKLPVETRQAISADIFARHQARKATVEAEVQKNPTEARAMLEKALQTWNMPGDAEWAQITLSRLPATNVAPTPLTPTSSTTPATTPLVPSATPAANDPGRVAWQVTKHLIADQINQADQSVRILDASQPDTVAIQRNIDLWRNKVAILKPAFTENRRLLRITNPQDGQGWDVVGIEDAGLAITSATGSNTRMAWNILPIREFARVAMEASAARKTPDARESAVAVILLTAGDDIALAQVHLNRSRGSMDDALADDLERIIELRKSYSLRALITQADEALVKGDMKAAQDAIELLKRQRTDPVAASELPRLEAAIAAAQNGKPTGATGAPLRDRLIFDTEDDLQSLPIRSGTWAISGGSLTPSGGSGSVGRKDLSNAKSVTILFQTNANRGALNINIRDLRILIDLQAQKLTATTRDTELKPVDVQITPRTVQTLYVEFRNDGNVLVEMNNGVISLDLRQQKAGDGLALGYDTDASFAVDEIAIVREIKLNAAAEAQRVSAIRAIGFEPIGQATMVPPAIHLPKSIPRSGIAFARRDGIASITIEAKGTGKLLVRYGKMNEGGGQSVDLELGATSDQTVTYTISCSGSTAWVRKGGPDGEEIISSKLQGDPPHLMIIASDEAIITSTPRMNRQ